MNEYTRTELVRVLELDYEKTTRVIESIISSSFTIRGWGITLSSALIGLTFQTHHWEIAVLAFVVTLLVAFVDSYHSWLYAKVLQHANNIEDVIRYYYAFLARGDVDKQAKTEFLVKIMAHRFGRFTEIRKGFTFSSLREARPRYVIVTLYATLLMCAAVSGVLAFSSGKHPTPTFGCVQLPGLTIAECTSLFGVPISPNKPSAPQSGDATLHLSPAVESALLSLATRPPDAARTGSASSISWWQSGTSFGFLALSLVILALGALLALVLRKRPKEAAPLGAVGLAAYVLTNPEHFSHLNLWTFGSLLFIFAGTVAYLCRLCALQLEHSNRVKLSQLEFAQQGAIMRLQREAGYKDGKRAAPASEDKSESPLTLIFSIAILLWALLAVSYHEVQSQKDDRPVITEKPPISNPNSLPPIAELPKLQPVVSFVPYSAETLKDPHNSLDRLKQDLSKATLRANDVLLLVGSADCSAIHAKSDITSNKLLAEKRAAWVGDQLAASLKPHIRIETLEQHETCKASDELRAVFPILIRPGSATN